MTTPSFTNLVGDVDHFHRHHFGVRPLYLKEALPGGAEAAEQLLSVAEMSELIRLEKFSPTYLRLVRGAAAVSTKAYTRPVVLPGVPLFERVDADKVFDIFHSGATVACNSLDHLLPRVAGLTDEIAGAFGTTGEAVAFLTKAGTAGLSPHHDPVDVFVLQMSGTKTWSVWDRVEPFDKSLSPYDRDALGEPALQVTLEPGDLLYMPPFVPHCATSGDEISLHIAVSVEPRRWRDLLAETLSLLMEEGFDEFPLLTEGADDAARVAFAQRIKELSSRLADLDPDQELGRLRAARQVSKGGFGIERPES